MPILLCETHSKPRLYGLLTEWTNSFVILDINVKAIWWRVVPVPVLNPSIWPNKDGSSGITFWRAINETTSAGQAVEAPSNFFLYFSSHLNNQHIH